MGRGGVVNLDMNPNSNQFELEEKCTLGKLDPSQYLTHLTCLYRYRYLFQNFSPCWKKFINVWTDGEREAVEDLFGLLAPRAQAKVPDLEGQKTHYDVWKYT